MPPENRLARERSSYLRSAAHQPVDWRPWGAEAFEKARAEDKPLLLDVGAVWCHWCHVMDRESYEDPEVAEVVNRLFVPVKVDRDERPDVDARYQKAVQAMTGQGGWPLTAFLLPDGRCFYAGTYFPPRDAHGRPSFRRVLEAVAEAYRAQRDDILANAKTLQEHLTRPPPEAGAAGDEAAWEDLLAHAVGHMREAFDATHGGFGGAPKFPHPAAHDFLLERGVAGDAAARDVAAFTLERMQEGGIRDHLGGGFHRYSVDARWHVPHFEKMLYDNAGLLRNYARAAHALGREDFLDAARDTARFLRDVLRHPEGGFGGSQDADVGLEDDGDFFTWTLDELRAAVPDERLARVMAARFDVRAQGDMHHDPARNVLRVAADPEALAAAFGMSVDEAREAVAAGTRLLQAARAARKAPFVDPVRYVAWNAMAAQALLEYGGVAGDAEADRLALAALDAMLREAWNPDKGFARAPGSDVRGLLDDHAQMLDALLEAHAATGEARWLDAARATGDLLLRDFRHPASGFADRASWLPAEVAPVAERERPTQDAPTASPNGVACRALLRLSEATGESRYAEEARAALRAMAGEAARLSLFGGALLLAMHEAIHPRARLVAKGVDEAAFRAVARREARPGFTFATAETPGVPEEARLYAGPGVLVCLGTRCLAPARTPEDLAERLREARPA